MNQNAIKRSIIATEKIRQITKAMQLVSANHLSRTVALARNTKPYLTAVDAMVHSYLSRNKNQHKYITEAPVVDQLIVVFSTDRGLCGALNLNTLKTAVDIIERNKKNSINTHIITFGDKALNFFIRKKIKIVDSISKLGIHPHLQNIIGILQNVVDGYNNNLWQEVLLIYPKHINTMTQLVTVEQLLPIVPSDINNDINNIDYLYEPNIHIVISLLLDYYLESHLYQATLELLASEQSARMVAMQNATNNAETSKHNLERIYHKARQAAITQEIAEIANGAEAL